LNLQTFFVTKFDIRTFVSWRYNRHDPLPW